MVRNLIVNKSGGTATLANDLIIEGSFSRVAGDLVTTGRNLTLRGSGLNLNTNTLVLGNVNFASNAVLTLNSNLIVGGNLTLSSLAGSSIGNGYQIFAGGDISSIDSTVAGNIAMTLNGTGNQTISGDDLFDGTISINKTSGVVTLSDALLLNGAGQQIVVQSGTLNLNGQTITTAGNVTVNGGTLLGSGSITNNLSVTTGAVQLSAASSGTHQSIAVGGTLALGGSSQLILDVSGNTAGGATNGLLTAASKTGSFGTRTLTNNSAGFTSYDDSTATSVNVFLNTAPTGIIADRTVNEDAAPTVIDLNAAFSDLQHADNQLTFTYTHTNGSLFSNISNTGGVLTFTHAADQNGVSEVVVTATDPRGQSSTATFTLTVNAVNDAPDATAPATATVNEGGTLTFNSGDAGIIDTFDLDGDNLTVTLTANHAGIAISQTTGLAFSDADGSDGTLVFSGSQADINAALDGLVYSSQGGYNGSATLTTFVSDGSLSDTAIGNITVNPGTSVFIWDGGGTTNDWTDAANWNLDRVPEADDIVIFDATSTKNATVDAVFAGTVYEVRINSGYTGTITQDRDLQTAFSFSIASGAFDSAGFVLDSDGDFLHTAGSLTVDNSQVFVGKDFINTSTFSGTGSTLTLDGAANRVIDSSPALHTLNITSSGNVTLLDDLQLSGNFSYGGSLLNTNGHEFAIIGGGGYPDHRCGEQQF